MVPTPDNIDNAPLAVEMLYPGDWWGNMDGKREDAIEAAESACTDAQTVAIVDSDADGLGCEVVLREANPHSEIGVFTAGHREPINIVEALNITHEHASSDVEVIVADLCPDEDETGAFCDALAKFKQVTVLDHHDWTEEQVTAVEDVSTFVHDSEKCATQLVLDHFYPNAPSFLKDFAEVTADHDLWIKEDCRSDDLADLSWWADRDHYIETARNVGANFHDDPETSEFIAENRAIKEAKIRLAVEGPTDEEVAECEELGYTTYQTGASWHDVNGNTIAILYGDCYASGACNQAIEQGADIAVLIREFNKLDFRSDDDTPLCADLAREFGGGGHPTAAGAKPEFVGAKGNVSFHEHWESQGEYVKNHVLTAIKEVTM